MKFEQIIYEVDDRIAVITLNRPELLNAWTLVMMQNILDALDRADNDDDVRVVIFTGAGRAYCAGADLSAGGFRMPDEGADKPKLVRDTAGRVTLRIFDMKKPVIAAINGPAVGVGITMTMAMDVRIASESATKIGFIFNRRGIVPEGCCTYFLPRIVGVSKAAELILTGRLFTAREGLEMGLFSRVVPPEELMPTAKQIAHEIADNTSAISTALARQMLWKMLTEDHPMSAHILESRSLTAMFGSDDTREGGAAFVEKRPPCFTMKPSTQMPDFYPWWNEPPFPEK
ncbi:MAG: crotonase/enoyl-CoA hydratase family protein [Deltaproteobacteria bacterium]|nr:crotonase/enoyl-CoA hydratase family protein [Deltaproteobacteria bacterium]